MAEIVTHFVDTGKYSLECLSNTIQHKVVQGFRVTSWNKEIKIFKCREKFQIALEISRKFLSAD
jgi:hypothetical protein